MVSPCVCRATFRFLLKIDYGHARQRFCHHVVDEKALDEDPGASHLAGGYVAAPGQQLQGLGMHLRQCGGVDNAEGPVRPIRRCGDACPEPRGLPDIRRACPRRGRDHDSRIGQVLGFERHLIHRWATLEAVWVNASARSGQISSKFFSTSEVRRCGAVEFRCRSDISATGAAARDARWFRARRSVTDLTQTA